MDNQLVEQLFETIGQLRKLLESHVPELHEDKIATIMQLLALKFLVSHSGASIGEIAAYLKLSKSSATQLMDRLAKAQLIERAGDSLDHRIVHLQVTSLGEAHLRDLKRKYLEHLRALLVKIPDKDLAELIRIHQNLIKTLQKE